MKPVDRAAAPIRPAAPPRDDRARLRGLARQLEGVFVAQLFKAMRQSIPKSGFAGGGTGEETFTAMMDEKMAEKATAGLDDHLGEALVRQLARHLPEAGDTRLATADGTPAAPAPIAIGHTPVAVPMPLAPARFDVPRTPPAQPMPLAPFAAPRHGVTRPGHESPSPPFVAPHTRDETDTR